MAENRNVSDLDKVIDKLQLLQKTIDHISKTKSISRFGKDIQAVIKSAVPELDDITQVMNILIKERDQLLKQLSVSPEHYEKALQAVFGGVSKTAGQVHNTFRQLFGNLRFLFTQQIKWYATKAVTLTLLRLPSEAIQSIREYNQGLTDIASVSRAAQEDLNELGKTIIKVATTTKYSVGQIAEAGKLLAQAGLDIQEINQSLDAIAKLATATGASLSDAADLMITALRSYKYEAADSAKLSDIFANAVTNSKVTIEGLRTAFNYVASTAANLNISLEDSVTLIGVLANSGQRLSTAATGLRTALLALTAPTQKMIQIFNKYGISVDQVNPSLHSMIDILKVLSRLSKEDLVHAFSIRSANAILALRNAGTEAIQALKNAVEQSNSATLIAKEQLLGLQNAWDNLRQTALSSSAIIGNAITNSIVDAIRGAQDSISQFNASVRKSSDQINISLGSIAKTVTNVISVFAGFKILSILSKSEKIKEFNFSILKILTDFKALGKAIQTFGVTLIKFFANPIVAGALVTLTAVSTVIGSLIKRAIDAKQALGNFLNTIDRQEVALGKVIQAYNKARFSLLEYTNKVREAYKVNTQLADSLIDLERQQTALKILEEINKNYKNLEEIKLPSNIANLFKVEGYNGTFSFKDIIKQVVTGVNDITDLNKKLERARDLFIEYFSDSQKLMDQIIYEYAVAVYKNTGEDIQNLDSLRDKVSKYVKSISSDLQLLIKASKEAQKTGDYTKVDALQRKIYEKAPNYVKDYVKSILQSFRILLDVSHKTTTDLEKDATKLSETLINYQLDVIRSLQSVKNSLYTTYSEKNKIFNDYLSTLKRYLDIQKKIEDIEKNGKGINQDILNSLKQQKQVLGSTLNDLRNTLNTKIIINDDLVRYFSKIDLNIKLTKDQYETLLKIQEKYKESINQAEAILQKRSGSKISLVSADEKTIKLLDSYIKNIQEEIIRNQDNRQVTQELREQLQILSNTKQALILTTNVHISKLNEEVDAYKQVTGATSDAIRQLIKFNEAIQDSKINAFIVQWNKLSNPIYKSSDDLKAFLKRLGLSEEVFEAVNKKYGEAAPIVFTYAKSINKAEDATKSVIDKYKEQINNIDQIINKFNQFSNNPKVKELIDLLKEQKRSITIDFKVVGLEKRTELQGLLQTLGKDNKLREAALQQYLAKREKLINDYQKRYGLSKEESIKLVDKQTEEEQLKSFVSIFSSSSKSILNNKQRIEENYKASIQELNLWYNEQLKNIAITFANNEEKYLQAKKLLQEELVNKIIKLELDKNQNLQQLRIEELNKQKEYLELSYANYREKAKATIALLEIEKKKAVDYAKAYGQNAELIAKIYEEKIRQASLDLKQGWNAVKAGIVEGIKQYATGAKSLVQTTADAIKYVGDRMTSAITDFLDITGDKFLSWKDLVINVLQDVSRQLTKMYITQSLVQGIMGALGGLFAPKTPVSGTPAHFRLIEGRPGHTGGMVGKELESPRKIPSWIYNFAPRLHTGGYIKSDEVPAILRKGEYVLTPEQMKIVASSKPNVNVQIIDQRGNGAPVEAKTTTDAKGNINIQLLVRDEVRKALASGAYDKTMSSSYGINRVPVSR